MIIEALVFSNGFEFSTVEPIQLRVRRNPQLAAVVFPDVEQKVSVVDLNSTRILYTTFKQAFINRF